jgi:hypothetical protein
MRDAVLTLLTPVRRRRQGLVALRALSLGVLVGALAGAVLIVAHRTTGSAAGPQAALAALFLGPVVGGLWALWRRPSWQSIAAMVDDRCQLQDRAAAALEFSAKASLSDFERLQVHDALRHLSNVRAREVAPLRPPREWPVALGSLAVACSLLAWPAASTPARSARPGPFAPALAEARELEEHAGQIETASQELDCAALKAIAQRMRLTVGELRQPGLDMRETMAKLSELKAYIAEFQKDNDTGPVEDALQSLGEAMVEARPLAPAGKALQAEQLQQAARALEEARSAVFEPREAQAVEPRLKQVAESMKTRGLDRLSRATAGLARGVKGEPESLKQGTHDLAKEIRDQDRRKRINELMAQEQRRLTDCKKRCEARNLMAQRRLEEQKNQGASDARRAAEPKSDTPDGPRDEPKDNAGDREKIVGRAGDGPVDVEENGRSTHGERTLARRPSRKVLQKYERISEAVLDREPIPLGHREAIRRYFELIRPTAADNEQPPEPGQGGREP